MKVRDLIAALSKFDQDLPVVVTGYESGMDDPKAPILVEIEDAGYTSPTVLGKYDEASSWGDKEHFLAVWIDRSSYS